MIVLYVAVVVIGSFIYTLIKVNIDEWLVDLSMKRLSLKRSRTSEARLSDNIPDWSDDSFDPLPDVQGNTEHQKYTNQANQETSDVSYNLVDATTSARTSNTEGWETSERLHDSIDLSSDDDVIIVEAKPSASDGQQSMFNWGKTYSARKPAYRGNVSSKNCCSVDPKSGRKTFTQSYKRKRTMNNTTSWDDEEWASSNDLEEDILQPEVTVQCERMISGIKVKFPAEPYPCQIAVMNSLIRGCNKEQNCLLESPTGSGKTLALLCGVLAWQEHYNEMVRMQESEMDECIDSCDEDGLDDNFFLNPAKYKCSDKVLQKKRTRRVPKIYYGTRTHKQIEQVIRELRKTAYRHKRMTILSSRDRTCIQDSIRNKNELCNELLDPRKQKKCSFYNEQNKKKLASFRALRSNGLETPWDIENLVSLGKDIKACPYFAARSLMTEAEIIFCPYNYIVDPNIREMMQIDLRDNIVILDEAHNIEDTCRDVAGVNFRDDELEVAVKECRQLLEQCPRHRDAYTAIRMYLLDIVKFLKDVAIEEKTNSDRPGMTNSYWQGAEFLELLNIGNVGHSRFPAFLADSRVAIQIYNEMKEGRPDKIQPTITRETKCALEHLCFAMHMLTSETVNDYRACIIETIENKKTVLESGWISKNCKQPVRTVKLVCMNPAITFASLACSVRSVILASGTLAPTSSFKSELDTQFPHMLNANHIISKEQVYVRCVPRGPSGKSLMATYENVKSWDFQDDLGNLVLQVCDAVPYGVLCFFSSYIVMNTTHDRWKSNGTWVKLSELKEIFVEPKDNKELPKVMTEYRNVIKESSSKSFREVSGAVLFAVYRGKVAEGIDFSDNEARCVLAVGIPYKSKTSPDVDMKMQYNNSNTSKGLLNGSEWYTVDAFRALNQAVGRCIRHKNDWGAVLLVDERYVKKPQNIDYLPKWIRAMWINGGDNLQIELEDFVAKQIARERERLSPPREKKE